MDGYVSVLVKMNPTLFAALMALPVILAADIGHGQTIQLSAAMPVTGQTVTITVPGLGTGGIITVTDAHGVATQLPANAASQAAWTPTRYGKYTVSSGAATQTLWVSARPMTFHWWSATLAQANVTTVMSGGADWQARGVTTVEWTGGEAYSRGVDGHWWTQAADWTNGWSYADSAGGMAIDEAYCEAGFPTDPIVQAAALERQARGANYAIGLWSSGFGSGFAADAAILKSNNVMVLVEDYTGNWNLHVSRWAAVRSYGLQNQAILGIWPGNAPLTSAAAVRADMALLRLAAPEANGIAIFAPDPGLLTATDQAIEDYFLKPLIYLSLPASGQLNVWNLGNDDASGFSLQFLDGTGGLLQSVDLSSLAANSQNLLTIPGGAVNAKIINPSGTANLYAGNSSYTNGLYPLSVPGRYVWKNANADNLWNTPGNWTPQGPPPGNIDSGNFACFDGSVIAPMTVTAKSGETSINSVQFATAGWTIAGNATSQDFYTYGISSSGAGTNTINIGVSARDVVPAVFNVDTGNTLVINGLVGAVRNSGGLSKKGLGSLVLTFSNTYAGDTTLHGGMLTIGGAGRLGNGTYAGAISLATGCTFNYDSSAAQTLSGIISGSGGLIQNGTGTLTLSGQNTLGGGVTVSSGTLLENGSLGNGVVTVAAAGVLGGTGAITGAVAVNGSIAPGAGVGTLSTGNLVLAGHYRCEIDGTAADKLAVTGSLNLTGASLNVSLLAGGFTQPHYVIASYTSLTGAFASVPAGYEVKYNQGTGANEIWLEEPAGYAAWAVLHAGGQAANLDHDLDGIPNGVEFFMGNTGSGFTACPGIVAGKLTWPKGAAYTGSYGTDYAVQTSPDLHAWTDVLLGDPNLSDASPLQYTLPANDPKRFVRLKVTGP